MEKPLWAPKEFALETSQLYAFISQVNTRYHLSLENYGQLYAWSIDNIADFWKVWWDMSNLRYSRTYDTVLENPQDLLEAQWFPGARLNFAENLLTRRDNKKALVFRCEKGIRRSITYEKLYEEVEKLAHALRLAGVGINDRVAGFMPNMIETVIAMLATTSIGAIWSSCSPDFGAEGAKDRFGQIAPKILFSVQEYYYNGNKIDVESKLKALTKALPDLEKLVLIHFTEEKIHTSDFPNAIAYDDFVNHSSINPLRFEQLPFNHPVYILYSSGTTGAPKCIVHGAGGTLLQHTKEHRLHVDLTEEDVFFYYTTCGWMMWNWLITGLASGATLVLYDGAPFRPRAHALLNIIDEEGITVFGTSAKYISALEKVELSAQETHSLRTLRAILSTGSPLLPNNFDYVYEHIKLDVCLSSISGGTDIISCFALGNTTLPVYRGELQCIGLGMAVDIWDEEGKPLREEKGELVCTKPFPSMPVCFWNDPTKEKYKNAYFSKYDNVWAHGDFARITTHDGMVIYGRSDAVLNPGGVRIGTAEIYRQLEKIDAIEDSIVVDQQWEDDIRIVLFVKLKNSLHLDDKLIQEIKTTLRKNATPRHVPAKIFQVPDVPHTVNGKLAELAVRHIIHGEPVNNQNALVDPKVLEYFKNIPGLEEA